MIQIGTIPTVSVLRRWNVLSVPRNSAGPCFIWVYGADSNPIESNSRKKMEALYGQVSHPWPKRSTGALSVNSCGTDTKSRKLPVTAGRNRGA